MSRGLQTTFELLAKTRNEAALSLLLPALNSTDNEVQHGALLTLLERNSPEGHHEIIRRLHTIDRSWRSTIEQRRPRMTEAIRDALLSGHAQLCRNACDAILWLRDYDLTPTLINAVEDEQNIHRDVAADTLLKLVELLYEELAAPRDYSNRRDPQVVRTHVLNRLEQSVARHSRHRRDEVLEAFLVLVHRDNVTLKKILMDPRHSTYLPLIHTLSHSPRVGVMRLVLSFLDDPHAPSSAVTLLAHRSDQKFVSYLLRKIGDEPSGVAALNLKRIESISWLQRPGDILALIDGEGQNAAVKLAVSSGMSRRCAYEMIEQLVQHGEIEGRRAAARALAQFGGVDANSLVLKVMDDPDPQVQAAAAAQLRPRGLPGALPKLIELVDSPHIEVRQAACDSLAEFKFKRFLGAYDVLDDDVRRSTGSMVAKIDPEATPLLAEEMHVNSHPRRLRAISMAVSMGVVPNLEQPLLALLQDEDHLVRSSAAEALADCNTAAVRDALRQALMDRSLTVQECARQSLLKITSQLETAPAITSS